MSDQIADTGLGGGSLFEFDWTPPAYDELGLMFAPMRYGRVEIDLGNGQPLADGVIVKIGELHGIIGENDDGTPELSDKVSAYRLQIATRANLTDVDMSVISIRVLS